MLAAARTAEQAVSAIMHAPLHQTLVRHQAIDVCRRHALAPEFEHWLRRVAPPSCATCPGCCTGSRCLMHMLSRHTYLRPETTKRIAVAVR